MKKNRWYDKHEGLANHLESLKVMPKRQLNELLKDLIAFARLLHPTLFEDHLFEYPLDPKRRRWYDDDPYLWLVVNGLRFTDDGVIQKVVAFFDKQIGPKIKVITLGVPVKTTVKKAAAPKKAVAKKSGAKKAAAKPPVKKSGAKPAAKKKSSVKSPGSKTGKKVAPARGAAKTAAKKTAKKAVKKTAKKPASRKK